MNQMNSMLYFTFCQTNGHESRLTYDFLNPVYGFDFLTVYFN